MKRLITLALLLGSIAAGAQTLMELNHNGAYEYKDVVKIDSTTAQQLYDRAMMALNDLLGSENMKRNIDYNDRDAATIVLKGRQFGWKKNYILGVGWDVYIDWVLKIRCKDGRAQVVCTVPSITSVHNKQNVHGTTLMNVAIAALEAEKAKGWKKSREEVVENELNNIKELANRIVTNITTTMLNNAAADAADDDF